LHPEKAGWVDGVVTRRRKSFSLRIFSVFLLVLQPNAGEEEEEEEEISDEEYTEDYVPATPGTKKRTIDEVNEAAGGDLGDESEAKKAKA
jgi:hypothetical protein